jgi:hypothetical protein
VPVKSCYIIAYVVGRFEPNFKRLLNSITTNAPGYVPHRSEPGSERSNSVAAAIAEANWNQALGTSNSGRFINDRSKRCCHQRGK